MEANKKIIVRAVYGCTAKTFRKVIRITYDAGCILGCTICGAKVKEASVECDFDKGKRVKSVVQTEIHIWYRIDNDTKVVKMCIDFSDLIEIKKQDIEIYSNEQIIVWLKEEPRCIETITISNPEKNQIALQVEYTLKAEIIGDTVLNVKVFET